MIKYLFPGLMILLCIGAAFSLKAQQQPVFTGQGPITPVSTTARPIQHQWKGSFTGADSSVFFTNDFPGARLNGLLQTDDTTYTVLITAENTPINISPWYAFKIWSATKKSIWVKLTYQEPAKHRYHPELSRNGIDWTPIDTTCYVEEEKGAAAYGAGSLAKSARMKLSIGPDTLWVAAQELQTSRQVFTWAKKIGQYAFATVTEIGKSREGRPLKAISIGNRKSKKMVMVISRQHPPEVTGYFAMQAFIETICSDDPLARKFREEYVVYVVPLMNPDGVDNGHWRHNAGGVDLNRDWSGFNHPETAAVRDFMWEQVRKNGGKFYFGIDFHSTWDDIYYTVDPKLKGNMPGLVPQWLDSVKSQLPGYVPNISPSDKMEPTTVSRNFFFKAFGAEALVYEIGDNTSRDFIRQKGQVGARELMRLILEKD